MPLLALAARLALCTLIFHQTNAVASPLTPFTNYTYYNALNNDAADLWWTINTTRREITFELHIKTTGWIALGISPAGGMTGADIGLGWVDQSGKLYFEDRYAYGTSQPVVDNTTADWFGIQGREQSGWTAIQFRRLLDTCDTMDVPIRSGTNNVIYAFGLSDPTMSNNRATITYHGNANRGSRIIPLQSYTNPPAESKFAGLDYVEFRLNNYVVPSTDTTYHCKIYRVPKRLTERKHSIAYKALIDAKNRDLVHHLIISECSPKATFDDDNNLPAGLCDDLTAQTQLCSSNIANAWAVGGEDIVEFPATTGYPFGGDFEIKYYMIQMHYDNPRQQSNRMDSSGIRYYLGSTRRQNELGYFTLGATPGLTGIAIPPRVDRFNVDSYCPAVASNTFPASGITVIGAFPHTHLQGRSVSTKIIRNRTAVQYLFNAEAYDFNYQFNNRFPEPIRLYRGDEFATRCVYSTTKKNEMTVGGESTREEMCLHIFAYYPPMNNTYMCFTSIPQAGWAAVTNSSVLNWDEATLKKWLSDRPWTQDQVNQWQDFFNQAPHLAMAGGGDSFTFDYMIQAPTYVDLKPTDCQKQPTGMSSTSTGKPGAGVSSGNAMAGAQENSNRFFFFITALTFLFRK